MTADATRLRAALGRWHGSVQDRCQVVTPALIRATGDVPVKDGELRASITADPVRRSGQSATLHMRAPVIQAATTDKGARPHVITPRRAGGLLVFHWPKAGRVVHLRRVRHPGNPPDPWWEAALRKAWTQSLRLAARQTPFR